jgi:HEAT repeat protein
VVIRRSAASDTRQLVSDLASDGPDGDLRREAAIARLRVIGARAFRHILPLLDPATPAPTRIAAVRALEGCRDEAAVTPMLGTLVDPDPDVRLASLAVARTLLDGPRGPEVLDVVTGLALDAAQPLGVRRAAVAALADLPPRTLRPLLARLRKDSDPAVRALVERQHIVPAGDPLATLAKAAEDRLPADPDYVLSLVAEAGASAPLPTLHRLVGAIRGREQGETRAARRRDWLTVRAAVHQALAARGSRVAAYDVREAIETAEEPLPLDFVRAATAVGDASVLEAVVGAFVRAPTPDASGWRAALADAAREIIGREQLTRRHGAVKRLRARYGDAVAGLLPR